MEFRSEQFRWLLRQAFACSKHLPAKFVKHGERHPIASSAVQGPDAHVMAARFEAWWTQAVGLIPRHSIIGGSILGRGQRMYPVTIHFYEQ